MKLAALLVPALLVAGPALAGSSANPVNRSGVEIRSLPAVQAIVYDNGAPVGNNGNETTAWVQAEDFSFGTSTDLSGAGVYLAGFDGIGNYDGGFQYYVFSDAGGIPGGLIQSGDVTPTITDTGSPWDFGGNIFLFEFDFTSTITAAAGVTYYLGIHASGLGDFNRDDIYWVNALENGTAFGVESAGGTFDNWSGNGVEHAFFLSGADDAVVPEPATWALMIAGFGLVGGAMRRRTAALAA